MQLKTDKTGIIDYGMGNLHSVVNALAFLGAESFISSDPAELAGARRLLLPGVGAFPDAMDALDGAGLTAFIREQAKIKPLLGICLGMQLLFDRSCEFRERAGLGLIPGEVVKLTERPGREYKIPHMGWNSLRFTPSAADCALLRGIREGEYVYFVHSYRAIPQNRADLASYTEHGEEIAAVVCYGKIFGAQFHPEKSERAGLAMLANFLRTE